MGTSLWQQVMMVGFAVGVLVGGGPAAAQEPKPTAPGKVVADEGEPAKVKALLKERLEVLREMEKALKNSYESFGTVPLERVLQASRKVIQAELELAETAAERVALREKAVAIAKEIEKILKTRHDAGTVPIYEYLEAKAARLEAEIALERERAKLKEAPKK
jgi:hypothetical protein